MRGVPRIPTPQEWVRHSACAKCRASKPWAKFPPATYWPDGTVRNVQSWCHECKSEHQRACAKSWPSASKSRVEYKREWSRRRRIELAKARDASRLPVEPIREFILRQLREGLGMGELADLVGIHERAIYRLVNEHKHVSMHLADLITTRLGAHLYDLYPDLAEVAA